MKLRADGRGVARPPAFLYSHRVSIYKVHFTWKSREVTLRAKSLDLTHPYFVSIKDILLPPPSRLIIDPTEEDFRKAFGKADHLMIPFQTVTLIEELKEDIEDADRKIRQFTLVDDDQSDEEHDS